MSINNTNNFLNEILDANLKKFILDILIKYMG